MVRRLWAVFPRSRWIGDSLASTIWILTARKKYDVDPAQRLRFEQRLDRAEQMAKSRLSRDSRDPDALFDHDAIEWLALRFCGAHREAEPRVASLLEGGNDLVAVTTCG